MECFTYHMSRREDVFSIHLLEIESTLPALPTTSQLAAPDQSQHLIG
jgi:hypothetical protein